MSSEPVLPGSSVFPPTRWTLILSAKGSPQARQRALETLLTAYWKPLYVFVRRKGLSPPEAQDAVQSLIVQLLERDFLQGLSPERGRMRSFLRTAAANHLANRHEQSQAARRGGGMIPVPLDFELAERLAVDEVNPAEDAFDRHWATGVMGRALERLRAEYSDGRRAGPFALIDSFFGPGEPPAYADAAAEHGMTLPQLKSFLHRARARFRELVREEVGDTIESPGELDAEIAHLVQVLGR